MKENVKKQKQMKKCALADTAQMFWSLVHTFTQKWQDLIKCTVHLKTAINDQKKEANIDKTEQGEGGEE